MEKVHELKAISRAEFDAEVLGGKGAFVVDLWADWCAPCRMLAPFIHKLAAEHHERVTVVKLDYDDNKDLKAQYDLLGIPALLYFNDGAFVKAEVGFDGYGRVRDPFLAFVEQLSGEALPAPSPAELRFIEAEKAAEVNHDTAETPARAEFFRVIKPANRNAKRVKARADKAFAGGTIDEAEKNRRIERAQAKLTAVGDPAGKLYSETMKPVERAYIIAMEEAVAEFLGENADAASAETEGNGNVCQIGNPTCRV